MWFPSPAYARPAGWSWFVQSGDEWHQGFVVTNRGLLLAIMQPFTHWRVHDLNTGAESLLFDSSFGMNAHGDVVGEDSRHHGAILQRTQPTMQEPVELNQQLCNASGWTLIAGYDINDQGQIVGHGRTPEAHLHAYLLSPITGDFDRDQDTDLTDFERVPGCFTGPGAAIGAGCQPADMDCDGDADLRDHLELQRVFTGSRR